LTDGTWDHVSSSPDAASGASTTDPDGRPLGATQVAEGARGVGLLVPDGWSLVIDDGQGSGSWSTWTSPADRGSAIHVVTGVSVGSWQGFDGAPTEIDPTSLLPEGAATIRYGATTFAYSARVPYSPYEAHGVWIGYLDEDGAGCCFVQAEVTLPPELHGVATEILNDFLDRHATRAR
jgi:hypothetical protein